MISEFISAADPTLITAVVGGVFTVFKSIRFVHEGERGCVLRFGKARRDKNNTPTVASPGFILIIPFVDTLKRRHVRQQTVRLDEQLINIPGNLVFKVSAVIRFTVSDIYKALFEIDELEESIHDLGMGMLRHVLQAKNPEQLRDTETISSELLNRLEQVANSWGVQFDEALLTSCAPTGESAHIIATEEAVNVRVHAVKKAMEELNIKEIAPAAGLLAALAGTPVATSILAQNNNEDPTNKLTDG